ncbi:hypothetical protein [Mangrovibacillus cuniculi]|uniref:DUF3168 domain-containing protein n=1 Tax=Mangrovibacillus cuniculi TaxID=2593652 RepID=A0A7S8CBT6_9BACI|nr:hypothetical protein [Mangrovibacillus cuniculi]QPC47110.1 hypothetical protein G8O30_09090 [Mangrovibacillus cuniculi]
MSLGELKKILEKTTYPVAYRNFTSVPEPPYICFLVAFSPNFYADNTTYQEFDSVQIELYTKFKDEVAEQKVKEVLNAAMLPFDKSETFIEPLNLYQILYEVRLIK